MARSASTTATCRPSGEKHSPVPPICLASSQLPTFQSRHGALSVISHLPSVLNVTSVPPTNGSSAIFVASSMRRPGLTGLMTAGRQPSPVRADSDDPHVVERPHSDSPFRGRYEGIITASLRDDPARSVDVDSAESTGQKRWTRRADAVLSPGGAR